MQILAIESSSLTAGAAIIKDDVVLAEYSVSFKKTHSQTLLPMIDEVVKMTETNLKELDAIAISAGPGSFTGLRIGMATVKGLSMGSNKPYLSISSLDALAYSLINFDGIICPIMDALRDSVFTCMYKSSNGELSKIIDYSALSLDELVEILQEKDKSVIFTGDGVYKYKEYLLEKLPNAKFAPNHLSVVKASALGELGMELLRQGQCDDINSSPLYLKKPQAERELEQRMKMQNGHIV